MDRFSSSFLLFKFVSPSNRDAITFTIIHKPLLELFTFAEDSMKAVFVIFCFFSTLHHASTVILVAGLNALQTRENAKLFCVRRYQFVHSET